MTEEIFEKMKNILSTVIEHRLPLAEAPHQAEARMDFETIRPSLHCYSRANARAGNNKTKRTTDTRFQQIAATFEDIGKKSAETRRTY